MKTDARRLVEASAWKTHLTETDRPSTPEFEAWLNSAPANQHAWDRVQESWNLFGEQATAPEVLDLRRKALGQVREAGRERWSQGRFVSRWKPWAMAAGIMLIVTASFLTWHLQKPDTYRTDAGERRTITLVDGSQVQLDALTELQVDFSQRTRDLKLIKGQARFDVAHDVERPFTVLAAEQKVIALGTTFNVDLLGKDLFVTLIEGKVVVLPQKAIAKVAASDTVNQNRTPNTTALIHPAEGEPKGDHSIELTPGQQLTVSATGAATIAAANVQRTTAWQTGQLIFDDEPLSSVITRINRYALKTLSVSKDAANLKLSGVFNTGDVDGFVSTLTHYLPVEARAQGESIQVVLIRQ